MTAHNRGLSVLHDTVIVPRAFKLYYPVSGETHLNRPLDRKRALDSLGILDTLPSLPLFRST